MKEKRIYYIIIYFLLISFTLSKNIYANNTNKTLDDGIKKIASDIENRLPLESSIIIFDFENIDGVSTKFGKYFSDKLTIQLANIGRNITVIGGEARKAILKEQHYQLEGYTDDNTKVETHKMKGANHIVQGVITEFNTNIEIYYKILDVEKGTIIGGDTQKINKTQEISKLLKEERKPDKTEKKKEKVEKKEKPKSEKQRKNVKTTRKKYINKDLDFGIKVGAGYATFYDVDVGDYSDGILSYNFNFFLTYNINNNFSVQPEIMYIRKGDSGETWDYVNGDYTEKYSFSYIEIPLLLKYSFLEGQGNKTNVYFGPYFAFLVNETYIIDYETSPIQNTKLSDTYNINEIDYGGAIGVEFYLDKFIADIRVTLGLLPVNADLEIYKNVVLSIMIGYELFG